MKKVILKNKFETSAEELKNSGVNFIPHNPVQSETMRKWWNRHEMWKKHERNKNVQTS